MKANVLVAFLVPLSLTAGFMYYFGIFEKIGLFKAPYSNLTMCLIVYVICAIGTVQFLGAMILSKKTSNLEIV
ncbi:MAG: hypothetical protein ACRC5M_00150 [Anaeroplasmataceae bacterium]